MSDNPFDSSRDPELGDTLRRHLDAADHAGFVRRVMLQLHAADDSWDVLGRWARPGVAAAVAFMLGAATWFLLQTGNEPASLIEAVVPGDAPARLFSTQRPDNESVLEVVLER